MKEVNKQKNILLDRRFGKKFAENALQKNLKDDLDEFNKASKDLSKRYKLDTPLINRLEKLLL